MGKIKINNIRLFANHGCLEEEGKIGSAYTVDVIIKANLRKSAKSDKLSDTVDYVHINKIVKEEMAIRSALLEHVADRILTRMLSEIPLITKGTVKVAKINPPIGGNVADVCIILSKKQKPKKK
jgi:dihydroneopterin aldolase